MSLSSFFAFLSLINGFHLSPFLHKQHFLSGTFNLCFKTLTTLPNKEVEAASSSASVPPSEYFTKLHLSPFLFEFNHPSIGFDVEHVDQDTWDVSSGVAQAWRRPASRATSLGSQVTDEVIDGHVEGEHVVSENGER
ncbi:hypothetical protein VNO80_09578 [Phaseolus coccineus]|uniref:Uncharacterized protein n=1 Tax=Phaseolus coccineus TaxID=3886 RepID=A0AAN9RIJ5_PHACN